MADLRLYRDIMCFSFSSITGMMGNSMITPIGLSATTVGLDGVIEILNPIEESVGRYFVIMDLKKYNLNVTQTLIWTVQYTVNSPLKNLITRFKVNPNISLGSEIEVDVWNDVMEVHMVNNIIEVEIV